MHFAAPRASLFQSPFLPKLIHVGNLEAEGCSKTELKISFRTNFPAIHP